jgi:hypothetical protein
MKNKKLIWRICVTAVILIVILTFSPLVTGSGKIYPFLFGLPFTLWMGIILTITLVVITLIAGYVLPDKEEGAK